MAGKALFPPPILERVKADHNPPPARLQAFRQTAQGDLQRFQLVVHCDPQGLKCSRRRIDPLALSARRRRHDAADQLGKFPRGLDWMLAAMLDNRLCDPPAESFLSQMT